MIFFFIKNIQFCDNLFCLKCLWPKIVIIHFFFVKSYLDKLLFGGSQIILALKALSAASSSPNWLVVSSHCLHLRLVSLKNKFGRYWFSIYIRPRYAHYLASQQYGYPVPLNVKAQFAISDPVEFSYIIFENLRLHYFWFIFKKGAPLW